jgi:hypothetical protein
VIVRVSGQGQWEVPDAEHGRLNALDDEIMRALEAGDEAAFGRLLGELLEAVTTAGSRLADDALVSSDVVLPGPDTTLEEARELFAGDGAIPD